MQDIIAAGRGWTPWNLPFIMRRRICRWATCCYRIMYTLTGQTAPYYKRRWEIIWLMGVCRISHLSPTLGLSASFWMALTRLDICTTVLRCKEGNISYNIWHKFFILTIRLLAGKVLQTSDCKQWADYSTKEIEGSKIALFLGCSRLQKCAAVLMDSGAMWLLGIH